MGVTGVTSELGLSLHPAISVLFQFVHFLRGTERLLHRRRPGPPLLEALPHADAVRPLQTGQAGRGAWCSQAGEKVQKSRGGAVPRAAVGCCLLLEGSHT